MGYFHVIIDAASSNSKTFEFYYFIKGFHEEIVCDRPPQTCRILNFLLPVERSFSDEKKMFLSSLILKKNQLLFHLMYQRYNKKGSSIFNTSPFEENKRILYRKK